MNFFKRLGKIDAWTWVFLAFVILYVINAVDLNVGHGSIFTERYIRGGICNYALSDWLINYEAGFVRRGLMGEILLFLWEMFHINPISVIYFLVYGSLFVLIGIFLTQFRKYNLSLFLLPMVFMFGIFFLRPVPEHRRDTLILLMIYGVFALYRTFLCQKGKIGCYILLQMLAVLAILSHEASVFFFVPIIFIHNLLIEYRRNSQNFWSAGAKALTLVLPMGMAFLLTSYFKGDMAQAEGIWHSWDSFFVTEFGEVPPVGEAVKALAWDMGVTFQLHWRCNFVDTFFGKAPSWIFYLLIFPAIYFCLMHVNRIKIGVADKAKKNFPHTDFAVVALLQFLFFLPMFTVLSCDMRRVVSYWVLSSFMFVFAMGDVAMFANTGLFKWVEEWRTLTDRGIFKEKSFYFLLVGFIGIPFTTYTLYEYNVSTFFGFIRQALLLVTEWVFGK